MEVFARFVETFSENCRSIGVLPSLTFPKLVLIFPIDQETRFTLCRAGRKRISVAWWTADPTAFLQRGLPTSSRLLTRLITILGS